MTRIRIAVMAQVALAGTLAACGAVDRGEGPSLDEMTVPASDALAGPPADSIHGIDGKCLDVNQASRADGARVQLWTCNATVAQRWAIEDARLVTMGKCFDVDQWSTAEGTKLQVWDCNGGGNQSWTFTGGQLRGLGGKCATVSGGQSYDGAPVVLRTCTNSDASHWTYVAGQLVGLGGRCLDIKGGNNANGTPAQLWDCLSVPQQTFAFEGSRLHAATGGCLDVTGALTANGTPVEQWSCSGSPQQLWTVAGSRVTGLGGKCLDVSNAGTTDGTAVQLWDCPSAPVVQQRWYRGDLAYAPVAPLAVTPNPTSGTCKFGGYCARKRTVEAHSGIDLPVAKDTPVYAICDGEITKARTAQTTPSIWDRFTILKAKNCGGYRTLYVYYGHVDATVGTGPVARGAQIGTVADWQSNTHLHFGLRTTYEPSGWGYYDVGTTAHSCGDDSDPASPDNVRAQRLATHEWIDPYSFGQAYNYWAGANQIKSCN